MVVNVPPICLPSIDTVNVALPGALLVLLVLALVIAARRTEADALTARLTEVLQQNDLSDDEPLLHTAFAALILDLRLTWLPATGQALSVWPACGPSPAPVWRSTR